MDVLITLFLAGDVMLGRGVDQILPHSADPTLHEPYVQSALTYVELAEEEGGPIERPVGFEYVWGEGLAMLEAIDPSVRIINLETALTTSDDFWPGKGIHYRMHPGNVPVLTAAGIDAAVLSNNHVLDWGYAGLIETIRTLREAGIKVAGAGLTAEEAAEPVVLAAPEGHRVKLFAYGTPDSGVFPEWAATAETPGVNYLTELDDEALKSVAAEIERHAEPGDLVVFSIHWGGNWGYDIPREQVTFARRLIDEAGVDVVHGHSSHHVRGIEIYKGRLILYGAGDLINDYEGIGGHEEYRPDLSLMYFPSIDAETGALAGLKVVPIQIRQIQLHRAGADDVAWIRETLNRESERFGVSFEAGEDGTLVARWE